MPHSSLLLSLLGAGLLCACVENASSEPHPSGDETVNASSTPGDVLIDEAVDVSLEGPRNTVTVPAATLTARSESPGTGRLGLYLEDLVFGRPGVYYEVYANLPAAADPDPEGPYYLGNLSHFGPAGETTRAGFEITGLAARLTADDAWAGELSLTFVRQGLEPAEDGSPPGELRVQSAAPSEPVRFSRVRVVHE